jgi:hypothetical protein
VKHARREFSKKGRRPSQDSVERGLESPAARFLIVSGGEVPETPTTPQTATHSVDVDYNCSCKRPHGRWVGGAGSAASAEGTASKSCGALERHWPGGPWGNDHRPGGY